MPLDPPPSRIVAKKGQKKVRSRTSGRKGQVTVIGCGNAVGQPIAICFGTCEEDLLGGGGEDWIQCTCGKWVHEECVEDCEPDRDGNPQFCPDCIEQYM